MVGWGIHESLLEADMLLLDTGCFTAIFPDAAKHSYSAQLHDFAESEAGKDPDVVERASREAQTLHGQLLDIGEQGRLAVVAPQKTELLDYLHRVSSTGYFRAYRESFSLLVQLSHFASSCTHLGLKARTARANGERGAFSEFASIVSGDAVPWLNDRTYTAPPSDTDIDFVAAAYALASKGKQVAAVSHDRAVIFLLQYGTHALGEASENLVFSRRLNYGAGRPAHH